MIITGQHDYSDKQVQHDVLKIIKKLENTTFIDSRYTDSWLSDFLKHVERNNQYDDTYFKDISTEQKFITELHSFFGPRVRDVDFMEDGDGNQHIIGTRFMIQGTKIYNANQEKRFVEELRAVCGDSVPYEVYVFHPYFIYFDQVTYFFNLELIIRERKLVSTLEDN